jgi:hypothetical protein
LKLPNLLSSFLDKVAYLLHQPRIFGAFGGRLKNLSHFDTCSHIVVFTGTYVPASGEPNKNEELCEFLSREPSVDAKLFDFLSDVVESTLTKNACDAKTGMNKS